MANPDQLVPDVTSAGSHWIHSGCLHTEISCNPNTATLTTLSFAGPETTATTATTTQISPTEARTDISLSFCDGVVLVFLLTCLVATFTFFIISNFLRSIKFLQ